MLTWRQRVGASRQKCAGSGAGGTGGRVQGPVVPVGVSVVPVTPGMAPSSCLVVFVPMAVAPLAQTWGWAQ